MIFIPFIDGLLSYDCRKCGWSCCQSGNLIMNVKEKTRLLPTYPFLKYFFTGETGKTYAARKYPRCWFLESNGLCHIQKKYGYSYKPFICRLHPFYIAKCKDEYIIVPEICSTLEMGKGNKGVLHKQILKNAKEAINYGIIQEEIDWPIGRLDLEKRILESSKEFINNPNYLDFAAHQISIATKNDDLTAIKLKLLESINLWKSFLEVDDLDLENKRLAYELTGITSLLRLENLQLRQMQASKVPLALLALYFYMLLFTKDNESKAYVQTYLQILNDISLGLVYLEKDDLKMKKPLEGKVNYLRRLRMLHAYNLMLKANKNARNPI